MAKRNQTEEKKKRRSMYEKYGHYIGVPTKELPQKHQCASGGLRCFKRIHPRDENGNLLKSEPKSRCGRACSKGSLYCKSHGGGNIRALVHGARTTATLDIYKGVHKSSLQDLMTAFINDPKILDMKSELAVVRTVMTNYMQKVKEGEEFPSNPKRKIQMMEEIHLDENLTSVEKFMAIKQITDSVRSLDDGQVIDRINRCVETIGKVIDRIHKIETKDDFKLTPEGLKIILRGIIDVMRSKIQDEALLSQIREGLVEVSVKTHGDLTKYQEVIEAEIDG